MSVVEYAVVFIGCFLFGGIIGQFALPDFPGKFFISGLVFAIFATGAGFLFLSKRL